jgi:hypothetical protein
MSGLRYDNSPTDFSSFALTVAIRCHSISRVKLPEKHFAGCNGVWRWPTQSDLFRKTTAQMAAMINFSAVTLDPSVAG